jgi:DMSO/TMAO reductase YedYZ molybdopterin-dependent catalytic subunit
VRDGIILERWLQVMKLKKIKMSEDVLKRRLILALCIGMGVAVLGLISFNYIQTSQRIDGAPRVLRSSFEWNEKIWKKISSNNNFSVKKPKPIKGSPPRVNGDIGLQDDLEDTLANYKVEVVNGTSKLTLPITAIKATPKIGYSTDFRCIEGWSEELQYAGSRFSDFMHLYNLGKKSDGTYFKYVGLETPDKKYYVSIDMESMLHPQTLLAYEMNEEPLSEENGEPIRLIIPIKYGVKSLKRIGKIIFSDIRPHDYWTEKGYDWYSGF